MAKSTRGRQRPNSSTQHTLTWTHPLTGKAQVLHLTVSENYLTPGTTHLEAQSAMAGSPNPLSATGYRSHFIDAAELSAGGGVMSYVLAWINREMPAFHQQQLKRSQASLFDWADARATTTAKAKARPGKKPARPATPPPKRGRYPERQPR